MHNRVSYVIHDIKSSLGHSMFLFIPIVILCFMFFGGFVIVQSLQKGMDNMEKRLGADFMIVPEGAKEDAQNLILEGARGTFYFNKSVYETILQINGVEDATPQLFLKSLSADCCSSEVEIVFFNPETDFIIQPWIRKEYNQALKEDMVVVGNSINIEDNGNVKIFGRVYKIAAKMTKTGTSLDNSVYFTFHSFDRVVSDAEKKGSFLTENQKNTEVLSSVFVNIKPEYKSEDILKEIHSSVKDKFEVVYPKQLAKSLSLNFDEIYTSTHIVIFIGEVLLFILLIIVNRIVVNEKKRDIALIRILGVSKLQTFKMLSEESVFICIVGSLTGCIIGTLFIIPFGNYIGLKMEMPYLGPDIVNVLLLYGMITAIVAGIGLITSIYPAAYISNLEPYIALRKEGE